jgi:hypothetical protein
MAIYDVDCFRDDHRDGYFPVRSAHYEYCGHSCLEAVEVAKARVASNQYDRVEVMVMGDPREVATPILFEWVRGKGIQP